MITRENIPLKVAQLELCQMQDQCDVMITRGHISSEVALLEICL